MKVIAIANGGFAIPTLRLLKESEHTLSAVFVMPVRTKRSGEKAGIPPVRAAIDGFLSGTPWYEPENINSQESIALLKSLNADVIFICDYGKILSNEAISTTKYGGINLHGSLLPKYRGAAPINRAIQAGERELGVSVIFIEPKVDAGPIVATDSYFPSLEETAVEIEAKLAQLGAPIVLQTLSRIEEGKVVALPQPSNEASRAPKLRKEEGRVDWTKSSMSIIDQYRAFQPWPRVFSDWVKNGATNSPTRIILGPFSEVDEEGNLLETLESEREAFSCGTIVKKTKTSFWVKTGDGALCVKSVQPAGKKNMSAEVFLRGYQLQVGDKLI
ncbi:MAG: methionyl-tRNA formyltransferase [Thermoguttaceae bacterium]|nr:methionyl-tRNA formyltransferase [Thermoguttaceae bacterium]MBR5759993.1 methionyl-tRNA formyltransferase [Thermoguttaceae bacterium]